jgi:hypothetical protein
MTAEPYGRLSERVIGTSIANAGLLLTYPDQKLSKATMRVFKAYFRATVITNQLKTPLT